MGLVERREEILKLLISRRKSTVPILMHEFHVSEKNDSPGHTSTHAEISP